MKSEGLKGKGSCRRWGLFFVVVLAAGVLVCPVFGQAEDKYPSRPINLVVGYAPGGASDIVVRGLANSASKILGQPVVVVNKPGGSSAVSLTSLKNEKPDGYTIALLATGGVISQHFRKVAYDSARDFTPIMQHAVFHEGLVVRSDSPWKTIGEFIDYAKANPGKIRYGSSGPGSPSHLVMEQLCAVTKTKMSHVPFEGNAPAVAALLGGHIDAVADNTGWKPHVMSGRLRLLAAFQTKRIPFAPNVPTLREAGYKVIHAHIHSTVGPKGMSPEVVDTLHKAFKKSLEDPEFIRVMDQVDAMVTYRSPEDLAKYLVELNDFIESMVVKLGLRKD